MLKFLVLICVIKITLIDSLEGNKIYKRSLSETPSKTTTEICKTKNIISTIRVNTGKVPCCQTCVACHGNPSCCCTPQTCHPIAIQCRSPNQNTDWYIQRNDSKGVLKYHSISTHLFVQTSISQQFNLHTEERGNSQLSSIVINDPNQIISNYVITAMCKTEIIFKTQIIVDGLDLDMNNFIHDSKCNPNFEPCKFIF